jgi:hypothetical protein
VNHARRDLCGGHPVMDVPTAIGTVFPHLIVETWLRNLRTELRLMRRRRESPGLSQCDAFANGLDLSPLEHVSPIEWDNLELCGQYPQSEARPPAPARKKVRP